ncbi:AraC family transcriptional regulator [Psychroflexus montanilacus]|uniref:AraC family transcriptional regulator n=1 Tax=Psychroflexus montanilacus TaxID=2873598 RepID=UPI001CC9ACDC|nr:AraC family transcriptional regulator [Psychroflexus montanilacus]MBZ9652768.1 AraC family transcriptional regulator [Psychroflexus montanilacus]
MALMSEKNIARGSEQFIEIEEGISILSIKNDSEHEECITHNISADFIQFHFCVKGEIKFNFNEGRYALNIKEDRSLLLYNPERDLPINLEASSESWSVSILISIKKLHTLFSAEANYIDFLTEDNRDKKFYKEVSVSPAMAVILSQILNFNLHPSVRKIYLKGKTYELIGLYFNRPAEADIEQCPFLDDEDNVKKIKLAKSIILQRMTEPPTLQALADEVGLSLKKLKEGFKEIYGDTVFSFLFDYKMDYARKLLEKGQHNVNEVGLSIGYSTASHFIAAFKKKFGTTPKKYIQG